MWHAKHIGGRRLWVARTIRKITFLSKTKGTLLKKKKNTFQGQLGWLVWSCSPSQSQVEPYECQVTHVEFSLRLFQASRKINDLHSSQVPHILDLRHILDILDLLLGGQSMANHDSVSLCFPISVCTVGNHLQDWSKTELPTHLCHNFIPFSLPLILFGVAGSDNEKGRRYRGLVANHSDTGTDNHSHSHLYCHWMRTDPALPIPMSLTISLHECFWIIFCYAAPRKRKHCVPRPSQVSAATTNICQ